MVVTQPDYYDRFSCIAGACPDSCCIGWQVVPDQEHLEFYRQLQTPLGEQIRSGIVNIDGEPTFAQCNGRCCMLREDGLCEIQYHLGEDALSHVCGFYPRFVTELGLIREQGLSISCPEVARMILTAREPLVLKTYTTDDPLRYFHDIEPERLIAIRQGRDRALAILRDRSLSLCSRMKKVLDVALQVDEVEPESSSHFITDGECQAFRSALYDLLSSLERLREDWTHILEAGRTGSALSKPDEDVCWEQLLSYYLFKYSLRASMDETFLESVTLGIVSVLLLQELYHQGQGDLVFLVQLYAKETEHNDNNLQALMDAFAENPYFSPNFLMSLLDHYSVGL